MKKYGLLIILILLFSLSGCGKTYKGTQALLERARQELPVSDAETIDLEYAGLCGYGDKALLWFISGNEYQAHFYLPMECTVIGKDEYRFERTYKPITFLENTAVLNWNGRYAFIVNNSACAAVQITDETGTHDIDIQKSEYPYVFITETIPVEYLFLDENGNELP